MTKEGYAEGIRSILRMEDLADKLEVWQADGQLQSSDRKRRLSEWEAASGNPSESRDEKRTRPNPGALTRADIQHLKVLTQIDTCADPGFPAAQLRQGHSIQQGNFEAVGLRPRRSGAQVWPAQEPVELQKGAVYSVESTVATSSMGGNFCASDSDRFTRNFSSDSGASSATMIAYRQWGSSGGGASSSSSAQPATKSKGRHIPTEGWCDDSDFAVGSGISPR